MSTRRVRFTLRSGAVVIYYRPDGTLQSEIWDLQRTVAVFCTGDEIDTVLADGTVKIRKNFYPPDHYCYVKLSDLVVTK